MARASTLLEGIANAEDRAVSEGELATLPV
jgi:hypothetical protein